MTKIEGYTNKETLYETEKMLVYRAVEENKNQAVIIKFLKQNNQPRSEKDYFEHEFQLVKNLNIPGVLKYYCIKNQGHNKAIVMEDFGGIALNQYLKGRKFNLKKFLSIAINVTEILGQIHKANIIHKDIKPRNILIHPDTLEIKIIDFSIATLIKREVQAVINPEKIEGSLAYISPEQTGRMNRSIDFRSDFYSLGVLFYEMFTGSLPFISKDPVELVYSHLTQRPASPQDINPELPVTLSEIILKLLSKTAEARYQNSQGLLKDLKKCYTRLNGKEKFKPFKIGEYDISEIFQLPEKLYGREEEIQILFDEFFTISKGEKGILLVTGPPGIGKTLLINEIQKPIIKKQGYYISGKFDILNRDIPYSSFIQAFHDLIYQILTESEDKIRQWKEKILQSIGDNGKILIDVIPAIEHIIGKQSPLQTLSTAESQNRFNHVFRNFLKVFAQKEHPLVLFLDDLQWADSASLKLLSIILKDIELKHFLLIGAYRDNEIGPGHQLNNELEELKNEGFKWNTVKLNTLSTEEIELLLKDTFSINSSETIKISKLIKEKTGGNPFFVKEFIINLYNENYIKFNNKWSWDFNNIIKADITDNIVDLMSDRIKRLPDYIQTILKTASCFGVSFSSEQLAKILNTSTAEIFESIREIINIGLLIKLNGNLKFSHDRIRETLYSFLDSREKSKIHLIIGKTLIADTREDKLEENIFDITHQCNLALDLLITQAERNEVARLNLIAGLKAKKSSAYEAAKRFFSYSIELLPDDAWESEYNMALSLFSEMIEINYLTSDTENAEKSFNLVIKNARTNLDMVKAYEIRMANYIVLFKTKEAIKLGREALEMLGMNMPRKASILRLFLGLTRVHVNLLFKEINQLEHLKELKDPCKLSIIRLLMLYAEACYMGEPEYLPLCILKILNISLKYGNSIYSPYAYMSYAIILCGAFGNIETGYRFGELSLKLLKKFKASGIKSSTYFAFGGMINHWKRHLKEDLEYLNESYRSGIETGNLSFASYALNHKVYHYFFIGEQLFSLKEKFKNHHKEMKSLNQEITTQAFALWFQLILNLTGEANDKLILKGEIFDETIKIQEWSKANHVSNLCYYTIAKQLLYYLYGMYDEAISISRKGRKYLEGIIGQIPVPEYYFYYSISLSSAYHHKKGIDKLIYRYRLRSHLKKFKKWAENAPKNYTHKYLIIKAEMLRLSGRFDKAAAAYEDAVKSSMQNGFAQDEAIANELTARFYLFCNMEKISELYMKSAYDIYNFWGAIEKADELKKEFPNFQLHDYAEEIKVNSLDDNGMLDATFNSTLSELEFNSVMKASQAISEEIIMERLLSKLLRIMMQNAGAMRGALLFKNDLKLFVEAEGNSGENDIKVLQSIPIENKKDLPHTIIRFVERMQEAVVLDNASDAHLFSDDNYIKEHRPLSVLCIPVIHQKKLIAILYLENNIMKGVFTAKRQETLKLLASQAAISIENAILYNSLAMEINERKIAEEASNMYKNIVSSSTDQMSFIDDKYIFRAVNDEFINIFNISRNEIIGHSIEEIFGDKNFEDTFRDYFEQCLSGKEITFEKWHDYPVIGQRYMDISLYPFIGTHGHVSGIIMNLRDSTDRLHMEKTIVDLREKERQQIGIELHDGLSHFLLGIAINSRMVAVKLGKASIPEAPNVFDIEKQINKAIEYTRKLARGLSPVYIDKINLMEIIEEKKIFIEENYNIKCTTNVDKSIFIKEKTIIGQLYFIIQEAIDNIIKHSKAKNINISLTSDSKLIELRIKDDGQGIPINKNKKQGMGLNIMKYRARIIGASLDIRKGENSGTEIICKLRKE